MACGLVKEAVLRQILQHLLTIHSKEEDDHVLLLAEEQLDTLQALLEEEAPRVDKPPMLRSRVHTNTYFVESDQQKSRRPAMGGKQPLCRRHLSLWIDKTELQGRVKMKTPDTWSNLCADMDRGKACESPPVSCTLQLASSKHKGTH